MTDKFYSNGINSAHKTRDLLFLVTMKLHAPETAPITTHPICFPLSNIQFSAAEKCHTLFSRVH